MDTRKFLNDIQSNDADVRFNAWRAAGEVDPVVISDLGKLAGSSTPGGRTTVATLARRDR